MDFNKVSTAQSKLEKTGFDFAEIGKLHDGVNHHRIIAGPEIVRTVWYPTLVEKEGKMQQGMRTAVVPDTGSVFDNFAKFDETTTKKLMVEKGFSDEEVKKYRSSLRYKQGFRFLVFDREQDGANKPTVRVFDYPKDVKEQLRDLQATKSRKNPGMLEYGCIFMFDVYITKTDSKKSGNKMYDTEYSVGTVTETLPLVTKQQKIPIEWANIENGDVPWSWEDYFTEDELVAIQDYPSDLTMLTKPSTETEILEKLQKSPIYLQATVNFGEKKGQAMFPAFQTPESWSEIEAAMGVAGLLVTGQPVEQAEAPKQISAGVVHSAPKPMPGKLNISVPAKPATEDAVVVDEQPVVPAPKATAAPAPLKINLPKPASAQTAPVATQTAPVANAPVKRTWAKPAPPTA